MRTFKETCKRFKKPGKFFEKTSGNPELLNISFYLTILKTF